MTFAGRQKIVSFKNTAVELAAGADSSTTNVMAKSLFDSGFDQLDRAILEELQVNSRISVADLARKIHLSFRTRLNSANIFRFRQRANSQT